MENVDLCYRCGAFALEHMRTHSKCWDCGFNPDFDSELSQWERIEFPNLRGLCSCERRGQALGMPDPRA